MDEPAFIPVPLDTIRAAYAYLGREVQIDLRIQVGDIARLGERRKECLNLLNLAHQVSDIVLYSWQSLSFSQHILNIPPEEYAIIKDGLQQMVAHLDEASQGSTDPPDAPFFPTTTLLYTGRPGRPRIMINPQLLETALELRGPTHLAPVFDCGARTIRRRGLEYGIVEPGDPVYIDFEQADGTVTRIYRSSASAVSDLGDDELDGVMASILEAFPTFGRQMIDGHLRHLGHRIPRSRLRESYARVHGAPANSFGPRRIERRVYSVPGPNSLWHHDGQHGKFFIWICSFFSYMNCLGLIRWMIIFHSFVDGCSRLVTGIRAHNNNRADTVLDLFLDSVEEHRLPSQVRGDHGTENVLVCQYMEEMRGIGRGSYIWGRYMLNALTLYTYNIDIGVCTMFELSDFGEILHLGLAPSGSYSFKGLRLTTD